ncbi:MAG: hypothetical protein WC197_05370 [Candidatus Gastranaerophilaceae bacterium]|jgi:hypothetical protein
MGENVNYGEYCKCGEHCQCGDKIHQSCHGKEECSCAEKFLKLADEAWQEVLKEKIKVEIEKKKGGDLEKLAEIIAKANGEKWKHKLSIKTKREDYKNTLKDFFTSK